MEPPSDGYGGSPNSLLEKRIRIKKEPTDEDHEDADSIGHASSNVSSQLIKEITSKPPTIILRRIEERIPHLKRKNWVKLRWRVKNAEGNGQAENQSQEQESATAATGENRPKIPGKDVASKTSNPNNKDEKAFASVTGINGNKRSREGVAKKKTSKKIKSGKNKEHGSSGEHRSKTEGKSLLNETLSENKEKIASAAAANNGPKNTEKGSANKTSSQTSSAIRDNSPKIGGKGLSNNSGPKNTEKGLVNKTPNQKEQKGAEVNGPRSIEKGQNKTPSQNKEKVTTATTEINGSKSAEKASANKTSNQTSVVGESPRNSGKAETIKTSNQNKEQARNNSPKPFSALLSTPKREIIKSETRLINSPITSFFAPISSTNTPAAAAAAPKVSVASPAAVPANTAGDDPTTSANISPATAVTTTTTTK